MSEELLRTAPVQVWSKTCNSSADRLPNISDCVAQGANSLDSRLTQATNSMGSRGESFANESMLMILLSANRWCQACECMENRAEISTRAAQA